MTPKFLRSPGHASLEDMSWCRFGRLVAVAPFQRQDEHIQTFWLCVCDCGLAKLVNAQSLRNGRTNSCGCLQAERTSSAMTKHGHAKSRSGSSKTYQSWYAMKDRCKNPRSASFPRYGGRGISFDPRWASFGAFLEDMGVRFEGTHLDRIDNNGNYERSNCRWSTPRQNANNMSTNHRIEVRGVVYSTVSELARRHGMKPVTVQSRLQRGWTPELAVAPLSPSKWDAIRPRV